MMLPDQNDVESPEKKSRRPEALRRPPVTASAPAAGFYLVLRRFGTIAVKDVKWEALMQQNRRDFLTSTAIATIAGAGSANAETQAPPAPRKSHAAYAAPEEVRPISILNLRVLEAEAQKVIPSGGFASIAGGAGDEWTLRENQEAFKRRPIDPRTVTGKGAPDLSTSLLGVKISMPIIVTPMAAHGLAHVSAEAGTAKGADAAGTLFVAPLLSNLTMEEIAQASPGPKWFQIYMPADRGLARSLLGRAKASGYKAIVVTADAIVPGNRETLKRSGFHDPLPQANYPPEARGHGSPQKHDLSWSDIDFVRAETGLPVIVKGVLSPDVAVMAIEHGAAAIQVSNHGGRQLDEAPATITVLPIIAEAVGGRAPIILDSGVRRGQDVYKALALGASAVALGRPVLYGLSLGGWMGVRDVLNHIKSEFAMVMKLAGAATVAEISRRSLYG
jgi:isopentenyl diphosphate isomerase/L-lactate dehydrogenase-like FMN-dependent dehydrogenase